ncbi:MAG: hypothetical protein GY953_57365, partial [bacterium]|nr:hypothetical protein [bacterium]
MGERKASELVQNALEYCLFPMTTRESLDQDGLNIYTHGRGVKLTDIHGNTYLD